MGGPEKTKAEVGQGRPEDALLRIAQNVSSKTGRAFFRQLVERVAVEVGAEHVFVGRLENASNRIDVVASTSEALSGVSYELDGTPCAQTALRGDFAVADKVALLFPQDTGLVSLSVRGYVASRLVDSKGACIGVLVALFERDLRSEIERIQTLLSVLASRASAELEREQAVEALEAAKREAEAAAAAKSEFLATMSHEIRTPLNAVLGFADVLLRTDIDPEQSEYLELIRAAGDTLLNLIDDVLDFSKVEAGRLEVVEEPVELVKLIAEVHRLLEVQAASAGLMLAHDLPFSQAWVQADGQRLTQVLVNLLSNALKFTEAGIVRTRLEQVDGCFRVSVTDTGPGIAQEARPRLFKPFSQADASTTRRHGGTGLGLVICQRLMSLMGGRIGFESSEGEGSTFWFELSESPLPIPTEGPPTVPVGQELVDGSQARILVAEDNTVNQRLVATMLDRLGFVYDIAVNGREALERWAKTEYAAVLMDCHMDVMDGYEATAEIRRLERGRSSRTPIIALTAATLPEDRARCVEAGMDAFLAKPLLLKRLAEALSEALRQ